MAKVTHLLWGWDGDQIPYGKLVPFEGKAGAKKKAEKLTAAKSKGIPILWLEDELYALIASRSNGADGDDGVRSGVRLKSIESRATRDGGTPPRPPRPPWS